MGCIEVRKYWKQGKGDEEQGRGERRYRNKRRKREQGEEKRGREGKKGKEKTGENI
jgi:hypothetical protein